MITADQLKEMLPDMATEKGWCTEFLVAMQAFLRGEEFNADTCDASRSHLSLYFTDDDALLLEWDKNPAGEGRLRAVFCWHTPHEVFGYDACSTVKDELKKQGYFNKER